MASANHETVGWTFRGWDGGHYICTHYRPETGFFMRCVKEPDPGVRIRAYGALVDVSERAIGRTYHRLDGETMPWPHDKCCLCYICKADADKETGR